MFCICTAGHVNHGKTSLVKSLTGLDTDRLIEEKKRGLSIELGYAKYQIDKNLYASIIDTPGHENFIRNMISGAHAVDQVILVIAANEGIMPQTIEHLDIIKLLSIKNVIFVISKIDLSTSEEISKIKKDINKIITNYSLNENEILEISNLQNTGVDKLKKIIKENITSSEKKSIQGGRFSVDRVFSLKGIGTIATGTLIGNTISNKSSLEILPNSRELKVKKLQAFNEDLEIISPGSRVSINIQNFGTNEIKKGDIIGEKNHILESKLVYVKVDLLKKIKNYSEIIFHTGSSKTIGKIKLINNTKIARINLNKTIAFIIGDKFIFRNNSGTVGGGEIIFHKKILLEKELESAVINEHKKIEFFLDMYKTISINTLVKYLGKKKEEILRLLDNNNEFISFEKESYVISSKYLIEEAKLFLKEVENYHKNNPLRKGLPLSNINEKKEKKLIINTLMRKKLIKIKDGFVQKTKFIPKLDSNQKSKINNYLNLINVKDYMPPTDNHLEIDLMNYLVEQQLIVKCSKNVYYFIDSYKKLKNEILEINKINKKINIDLVRKNLGMSRKYCLAILDRLEEEKVINRTKD
ncbi:MAG: selenocysteine-specific translation elongation factor [SAR202 cluster bacterium]|nr:selenocysteine-specific translation elongation factor [SAR202 cluster bacterium]|tara:strand:+ start:11595 stop:13343 length:1749 start_codon:yes stop_codon:yes gene_type:complete